MFSEFNSVIFSLTIFKQKARSIQ